LLRFCREELLVHRLVAQQEKTGRKEELERGGDSFAVGQNATIEERYVAEELEVGGRKGGVDSRPSSGEMGEDGKGDEQSDGGKNTDGDVHIRNRGHACDGGEEDDEGGDDVLA